MKKQAYWQVGDIIGMIQNDNNKKEEMKTEPTEAYIIAKRLFDYEDEPILESDICEIADIAFQEGQSNPKIQQLEWVNRFEFSDELGIKAQTPFCTYTIIDMEDSGFAEGIYLSSIDDVDVEVSSFDEGKKLAQEDFERRVKECLIIE